MISRNGLLAIILFICTLDVLYSLGAMVGKVELMLKKDWTELFVMEPESILVCCFLLYFNEELVKPLSIIAVFTKR